MTIVKKRLALINQYLKILDELKNKVHSSDVLEKDVLLRGAVKRYLHLTIEALMDIGLHICSELDLQKPERYRDIASILYVNNIIDYNLSKIFELWIGFRNILVHVYSRIDLSKIFDALNSIDELKSIASKIASKIREKNIDPPKDNIVEKICSVLCEDRNILAVYVFGSYVSGKFGEKSDIDIAIYVDKIIGWKKIMEIKYRLEDSIGRKVDLVSLNEVDPEFAYLIISKGRRIFARNVEQVVRIEVEIIKRYLDIKPRLEKYYQKIIQNLST